MTEQVNTTRAGANGGAEAGGLARQYEPGEIEAGLYARWMKRGYFAAEVAPGQPRYCITIPPPNVTGELHIGHGLCYTIHDVLVRWKRMQGFTTLCLPGTDHAGIATQNVVERMLARDEGLTRHDLGREAFVERVWEWKEKYGSTIIEQMKKLGCSFDWSRERFTMDAAYTDAVLEAFIHLFNKGMIYRGYRVTNWCPRCRTAISNIEADEETRSGSLWRFRYPVENGYAFGTEYVVVATTRPETMLGDTAVAVHPDDRRYQSLIGQHVILPLMNRRIPIVGDAILVDPEFGTGAVKVTPAHDFNDFEAGERNHLAQITVIGPDGRMTEEAGEFAGMDRFEARAAVVARMEQEGLLLKAEDYSVSVPICDRCKTVLEPLLSDQWWCRMKELAAPAMEAVRSGQIRFLPERWGRVYLEWMERLLDWNISRQLWWGHRIPIFYCGGCGNAIAARSAPRSCSYCGCESFTQDPDVLDTWFSSGLWPFATLGWPAETLELDYFYPTDVLLTAPEIIYLWVARMIFMGLEFIDRKPFTEVYIYATVLDAAGDRMSKNKGNGVNPVLLVNQYGADATRYAIVTQAGKAQQFRFILEKQCPECARQNLPAEQQWVLLDASKCKKGHTIPEEAPVRAPQVAQARLFCTKIWQASRFVLMNLSAADSGGNSEADRAAAADNTIAAGALGPDRLEDRWIRSRLAAAVRSVNDGLASYDLDVATRVLHEFVWNEFCDWYIEMAKPRLALGDASVRRQLSQVLDTTLRLLHPFMPFLTETIWQNLPGHGETLMRAEFPRVGAEDVDIQAEQQMNLLMDIIVKIRNIRAELKVPPGLTVPVFLANLPAELVTWTDIIENRARCKVSLETEDASAAGCAISSSGGARIRIPLEGLVDMDRERARLDTEISGIRKEMEGVERQLANEQFIARAPVEVVAEKRRQLEALAGRLGQAVSARERLLR